MDKKLPPEVELTEPQTLDDESGGQPRPPTPPPPPGVGEGP